jgi:hypothetical protein
MRASRVAGPSVYADDGHRAPHGGILSGVAGAAQPPWRDGSDAGAVLSPCGRYRYALWRRWHAESLSPSSLWPIFVMLNPSTADASVDDATVRKVRAYCAAWGYRQVLVVNLFAWRATDPRELREVDDPVGPDNDAWLERASSDADLVLCAWGTRGGDERARRVRDLLSSPLEVLALTKDGHPAHPLYLKGSLKPTLWRL